MQTSARLLLNVDGKNKSYILRNGTESYFKKLRSAYSDILSDKQSEYLYFGFFTLCAATLEYSLNFILIDFCLRKFGLDKYKSYAEAFINISFAKKLLLTPNIISDGEFVINEKNHSYNILLELIRLRNKILHNKDFLKDFEFSLDNGKEPLKHFEVPLGTNHIDTLTKEKCIKFEKAINEFKKFIMKPSLTYNLLENDMMHQI